MGRSKRSYQRDLVRFSKTVRMPLRKVLAIMPDGFSEEFFLLEFKRLYAYLWDDICSKEKEYKFKDKERVRKGCSPIYYFPSPLTYLRSIARPIINNGRLYNSLKKSEKERIKFRETLLEQSVAKQKIREEKVERNLMYVQQVTPRYSNYYIQVYFSGKQQNPSDVNSRYAVLVEASKYKSPVTIKFLHKVNRSERNFHLRYFAFQTLQKFGEKGVCFSRNRKGKKRKGDKIAPVQINTPDDLIHFIYSSQLEQMKKYDLFLSHSSSDSDLLLSLKSVLNHSNINVYIDWVSDRNALKRELTNANTANAIIERLKSSKALLYVHTQASQDSRWTPWELGFFHAFKGKICIYNPENIEKMPYLDIYPTVVLDERKLFVETENGRTLLQKWIEE